MRNAGSLHPGPGGPPETVGYRDAVARASGGIGRRAGFRFLCPKGCGGSSPPSPTQGSRQNSAVYISTKPLAVESRSLSNLNFSRFPDSGEQRPSLGRVGTLVVPSRTAGGPQAELGGDRSPCCVGPRTSGRQSSRDLVRRRRRVSCLKVPASAASNRALFEGLSRLLGPATT